MNNIESLKKRADKLAEQDGGNHIFLESTDFKDAAEREARRAELEKIPGNVVVLLDSVDGAHPEDAPGTVRILWGGKGMNDEDLARHLLALPDTDKRGKGITTLSNRKLADLLLRDRGTPQGPGAVMEDRNT